MSARFTVINAEQRSAEWHRARAGRLTGSMAHTITMKGKKAGEESKTRHDYLLQLSGERFEGESQGSLFHTADMERGIRLEPYAFGAYEAQTGAMVLRSGFLSMNEHMAGCSLDGHTMNYTGIIELKCPKPVTHFRYMEMPSRLLDDYRNQVSHNLWVTGAPYCDLCSFYDRVPKDKQLIRVRVERYDAGITQYAEAAIQFLKEVDAHYQLMMNGGTTK